MQVKIGDKVRFLNDVGGGVVIRFIDAKKVMVLNEDGFEIPVLIRECVVVGTAVGDPDTVADPYDTSTPKRRRRRRRGESPEVEAPAEEEEEEVYTPVEEVGPEGDILNIFYICVPEDTAYPSNSGLKTYLVNDSNYWIYYSCFFEDEKQEIKSRFHGLLEPNTKFYLESIKELERNKLGDLHFHMVFFKKGVFQPKNPIAKTLHIDPKKFYKESSYQINDYFNEPAMVFPIVKNDELISWDELSEKELREIIKEKEPKEVKRKPKKQDDKNAILEVDLHIEALLDDVRGLSKKEMLEHQMNVFHETLEAYKNQKGKKIVFIHGVGNGTLKTEVRKQLQRRYGKYDFQDASFREYGYGATMVIIK